MGRMHVQAEEHMWPRWVPLTAALFSVGIAALAPVTHTEGATHSVVVALTAIATIPWLIEATGRMLPRPLFALGVFLPLTVLNVAGGPLGLTLAHDGQLSFMLVTLAVGELAARSPLRRVPAYALPGLLMPYARYLVAPGFDEWFFWSAGILLGTGAGILLQRQHALVLQLREAQGALAEEAARQERRRIAREVHDVIAHSLTVSMLHITAARLAVRRDAGEAAEALEEAERLGRQALADVRQTVGLLHDGDKSATAAALPGASDLPDLVGTYAAAGLDVRLACDTDLQGATPAGGLALYRAVQEGLANAAKHAPGTPVTVTVTQRDDRLVAEVVNRYSGDTAKGSGGMGLRGMRERVEAVGGSVVAGPRADTWVTSCAIPLESSR